ncbi:hypothetical protein FA13DRAFT_1715349 [Coprinellus micaceus]|uniref:Uncharacterized protein n=1 Tax=Coprinellus micaceus TaxID=71717 RepID=A0A4Y7SNX9_COPMI|nr:hypothetical protein FA13DRAFT_1715349 [Coprinellus micaceus]
MALTLRTNHDGACTNAADLLEKEGDAIVSLWGEISTGTDTSEASHSVVNESIRIDYKTMTGVSLIRPTFGNGKTERFASTATQSEVSTPRVGMSPETAQVCVGQQAGVVRSRQTNPKTFGRLDRLLAAEERAVCAHETVEELPHFQLRQSASWVCNESGNNTGSDSSRGQDFRAKNRTRREKEGIQAYQPAGGAHRPNDWKFMELQSVLIYDRNRHYRHKDPGYMDIARGGLSHTIQANLRQAAVRKSSMSSLMHWKGLVRVLGVLWYKSLEEESMAVHAHPTKSAESGDSPQEKELADQLKYRLTSKPTVRPLTEPPTDTLEKSVSVPKVVGEGADTACLQLGGALVEQRTRDAPSIAHIIVNSLQHRWVGGLCKSATTDVSTGTTDELRNSTSWLTLPALTEGRRDMAVLRSVEGQFTIPAPQLRWGAAAVGRLTPPAPTEGRHGIAVMQSAKGWPTLWTAAGRGCKASVHNPHPAPAVGRLTPPAPTEGRHGIAVMQSAKGWPTLWTAAGWGCKVSVHNPHPAPAVGRRSGLQQGGGAKRQFTIPTPTLTVG